MEGSTSRAAYFREYRKRKKAERLEMEAAAARVMPERVIHQPIVEDAAVLIRWIEDSLKVPTGPLMGRPFRIDAWQQDFIREALEPGVREAGLSVARKNGKSGVIAAVLLGCLVGPFNRLGWRAVVSSMTGNLAKELRQAVMLTAIASGLADQVQLRKAPPPGHIIGLNDARVDFLAADKATGHAVGADLALIDEAGLLQENHRDLWNALYTSISGRNGRFWAISIQGDGPMFAEMGARKDTSSVVWHHYAADPDANIWDESQWDKANPGLKGGIKSRNYMRDAAERAKASTANEMHFRAYDLNMPVNPDRETIVSVSDWVQCVQPHVEHEGDAIVAWDLGGSASMTCAAILYLGSWSLQVWGAFGDDPPLNQRARHDRMGTLYDRMVREGELQIMPGRVTPVVPFMQMVCGRVSRTSRILAMGCDRYRRAEAEQAFHEANVPAHVPVHWRGQGAHAKAHGSADVRAFQKAVYDTRVKCRQSTMMEAAIASSVLRYDNAGNPALDKAAKNARIDALSAAVIAVGIGTTIADKPLFKHHVI